MVTDLKLKPLGYLGLSVGVGFLAALRLVYTGYVNGWLELPKQFFKIHPLYSWVVWHTGDLALISIGVVVVMVFLLLFGVTEEEVKRGRTC